MGEGPIPAGRRALKNAGLTFGPIDVIERNDPFAAQALAVMRGLDLDPNEVIVDGGAMAP